MIKFWKSSVSGSGSRNYLEVSSTLPGHFPQFGSYLGTNSSNLRGSFTTNVTLNEEVLVTFWKSCGLESVSAVCTVQVLLH